MTREPLIGLVVGTRPDIIKMAPLIHEMPDALVIHTGQHYSPELDAEIRAEHGVSVNIQMGPYSGDSVADNFAAMAQFSPRQYRLTHLVVYGDTLSAAALAMAGVRAHVPVAHVEAGLRSRNLAMPEEVARIMIDACASLLLAPTREQASNLQAEQVKGQIEIVGNLVQDALDDLHIGRADAVQKTLLLTLHRRENFRYLYDLICAAARVAMQYDLTVVFPCHPSLVPEAKKHANDFSGLVSVVPALARSEFLHAMASTTLVMSDSGGVQEECALLGVPCVTLRTTTERPETVDSRWCVLWHPETAQDDVLKAAEAVMGVVGYRAPMIYAPHRIAPVISRKILEWAGS